MLRDILGGNIDASRTGGKIKLVLLLTVLSCLFNYDQVLVRPVIAIGGFFTSLPVFKGGDHLSSSSGTDWLSKVADHNWLENFNCDYITAKIEQPFGKPDLKKDISGHFEKLAFRFMPFLIAHVLHLDHRGLYCLQLLLGILFPLLIWKVLHEATNSFTLATAGAVLAARHLP